MVAGFQSASAKVIGIENGPGTHLWNIAAPYVGHFASFKEFRNTVAKESGLDPKQGEKSFRHLGKGFAYKIPDFGSDISQIDVDKLNVRISELNAELSKKQHEIEILSAEKTILDEKLKKAGRLSFLSWLFDLRTIILIILALLSLVALKVMRPRQNKMLVVEGEKYDAVGIQALVKEKNALRFQLNDLQETIKSELYRYTLSSDFKRTKGTSRYVYFHRDEGTRVVFRGLPHPVEIANLDKKVDEAPDDMLVLNGIQRDNAATRRNSPRVSTITT